jgi:hypothetical protein
MKRLALSLLVFGAGNVLGQEAPALEHDGVRFLPTNCEIMWGTPTNQYPKVLWIYKTIPQHFSNEAISNLVALGSLTTCDKSDEDRSRFSAEERAIAKTASWFENQDERRSLGIFPATGFIRYRDQKADDIHSVIEDVPSEATTQELGLKLLGQIGIPRSELATKPNSSDLLTFKEIRTRGHLDKERRPVKETDSRGVFFVRQIGGVSFAGIGVGGGFHVRFFSHAKVAQLELVWRDLQPYKKYAVASPGQIMQWIKDGKAVVILPDEGKVNPREVKKLTITEISPLYMGALGETRQDFTYPFAKLDTIADTGQTNVGVQLYCPILSNNEAGP